MEAQIAVTQAADAKARQAAEALLEERKIQLSEANQLFREQQEVNIQERFQVEQNRLKTQAQQTTALKQHIAAEKAKQEAIQQRGEVIRQREGFEQETTERIAKEKFEAGESVLDRASREKVAATRSTQGGNVDLSRFTGQQILNATNLLTTRFGRRIANRQDLVLKVLEMTEADMTIDEIDDTIRRSGISPEFAESPIRAAFNSVAVTMSATEREQLEHVIDQRLEAGDVQGAQRELMSGIVKQMDGKTRQEHLDRQEMLASLSEIRNGLNALADAGISDLGPGTAIENWLREKGRLEQRPEIARLIQRMRNIFVIFRGQMSGANFGVAENEGYKQIFPSPDKNLGMNRAILDSLIATNLQNGRNVLSTIVPGLADVVQQEDIHDFLIGSVNPASAITGGTTLTTDQSDQMITIAITQKEQGATPEQIRAQLEALNISPDQVNEIMRASEVR
tara:strand:- start:374 stop:1732 length:1359 start_codon:yes stop_codon:yes gene_type:complete